MRLHQPREWAILAAVWVALVIVVAVWSVLDRHPPEWDYANHLERAVLCGRDLSRGDVAGVLARSTFYPPLVPCVAGLAYQLLPSDEAFAHVTMLVFLAVGMAATYVLARRYTPGPGAVAAAILFGTAPFVVHLALRFQLDLPLATMVATFLAALLASERFTRTGWTLAAGVLGALGMLTKPPFAVYVAPPLLVVLARTRWRHAWLNAGAAGLIALLGSLPWYGPRVLGIPLQIRTRAFDQAVEQGHPAPWSLAGLTYYPLNFPAQFGLVAAALFVIGVLVALTRRHWTLLAGLAPFFVFLAIQNKNLRYTVPLLPVAAVCAGIGFAALGRRARRVAAACVAVAAAVQVYHVAYGLPLRLEIPRTGIALAVSSPPDRADWRHREILGTIVQDAGGTPATVSIVPNNAWFSVANFRYYGLRDGLPLDFARAWDVEPLGIDYMVLKSGDIGPPWTTEKPRRVAERLARDGDLAEAYPLIGEFALPDGSTAWVRTRRVPEVDATPERVARAMEAGFRQRLAEVATEIEGLDVVLDYDEAIRLGRVRRIRIAATAATVGELRRRDAARIRLRQVMVTLDDVIANPLSAVRTGRFDLLDAGRLRVERVTVAAEDFGAFLRQARRTRRTAVAFGDGFADVRFDLPGPDVRARVRLRAGGDYPFAVLAEGVRLGPLPVPGPLAGWVMRSFDPSPRIARRVPFPVEVGRLALTPMGLQVGEP